MPPEDSRKIYVLDTSIILFDAEAPWNLGEHDVGIPLTVLEELDRFKKGDEAINEQARDFIRRIDGISNERILEEWVPLDGDGKGKMKVIHPNGGKGSRKAALFFENTGDNRILSATLALKEAEPGREVVLLSQDINLRVKARGIGISAEEYRSGLAAKEKFLYTGRSLVEAGTAALVQELFAKGSLNPGAVLDREPVPNEYFVIRKGKTSALAFFNPETGLLEPIQKRPAYGIVPKNSEQSFALHAVLNPAVPLVSIGGKAGTGKTLLALAAALEQRRLFHQIYLARPIVALSNKDIGYLPGKAEEKINPFMMPLFDNLALIKRQFPEKDKEYKAIEDMLEKQKLLITPLAYIRGRSLSKVIFIVDEAQNLNRHEMRTIVTRAGEGTKIVFTGDINQIDSPYLNAGSNGLSHLIAQAKGNKLYAHVTLEKGERSELARMAADIL